MCKIHRVSKTLAQVSKKMLLTKLTYAQVFNRFIYLDQGKPWPHFMSLQIWMRI